MYTYEREKDNAEFTGYMVDESSLYSNDFDYHGIYRSKEFNECCKYFNNYDEKTRKILLAVNEADQNVVMQALANKLYSHIVNKVDDVDFGQIPLSRGDIKNIPNYEQLVDCLNILSQILQNYKQDTKQVDTVNIALQNTLDRTELYKKAYKYNVELPIITYNTVCLSIISATSLLISSHIEFIKMNDNSGYDIAFDKASRNKTDNKLLFNNLERYNKICANGDFDKAMDYAIKNNIQLRAESVGIQHEAIGDVAAMKTISGLAGQISGFATAHPVATAILAIIILVRLLREFIYYFYYARTKLSDYLDAQSALLYMNALNIENSLTQDDKKKKDTAEKQKRIANAFSKLADKIKVKDKTSEAKAESDINKLDKEKFNINDVIKDIPDSANAALF